MRSIASIFGRDDETSDGGAPLPVESFACVHHDGRFCVLRLEVAERGGLDADRVTLVVVGTRGERRFPAIEHEREGVDETSVAEFMLPAALLEEEHFALEIDGELSLLPAPTERLADAPAEATTTEEAHVAQQRQIDAQAGRIEALRREIRELRTRALGAEEELEEATSRFGELLASHRTELHHERERSKQLERRAADAVTEADHERALREELEQHHGRELDELRAARDDEAAARKAVEARLAALSEQLAAESECVARLESELEHAVAAGRQLDELSQREAAEREALEKLGGELEAERAAHATGKERLAEGQADLERERERTARLDRELAEAGDKAAELADVAEREAAERQEIETLRDALAKEEAARAERDAELREARDRVGVLEREQAELDGERARLEAEAAAAREAEQERTAELSKQRDELERERGTRAELEERLAEARSALGGEQSARGDLAARLEAAESALAETRQARYRIEQRAKDLEATLAAAGGDRPTGAEPPAAASHPEISDLSDVTIVDDDGDPAVNVDSLVAFEVDALAELYALALDATRSRERTGANHGQGERWRQFARAVVEEASRRPELHDEEPPEPPRGVRGSDRRRHRLRTQLRAAARASARAR